MIGEMNDYSNLSTKKVRPSIYIGTECSKKMRQSIQYKNII